VYQRWSTEDKKKYCNKAKERGNHDRAAVRNRFQSFAKTFGGHLHAHYDDINKRNVSQLTSLGLKALSDSNTQEGYSAMEQLPSPLLMVQSSSSSSSSNQPVASSINNKSSASVETNEGQHIYFE